jgi:peptidoglycan/xylan/chitin deacetylase (PgdA/CDA1 family)
MIAKPGVTTNNPTNSVSPSTSVSPGNSTSPTVTNPGNVSPGVTDDPNDNENTTPSFTSKSKIRYGVPKGYVALTFDDGPGQYTKKIVDLLVANNIKATFFFVGNMVQGNGDLVKYAADNGMSVQSHSWSHPVFSNLSESGQSSEVTKTVNLIESYSGTTVTLLRPPYGSMSHWLRNHLAPLNLQIMLWNRDPRDWAADSSDEIVQAFKKENPSGGVYVMHEKPLTYKALPRIIEYLQNKGLKFAVVN